MYDYFKAIIKPKFSDNEEDRRRVDEANPFCKKVQHVHLMTAAATKYEK